MSLRLLKMKSPLGTMLTLYLVLSSKYNILDGKHGKRNTFLPPPPEREKWTHLAASSSEFIAELRLPEEIFYVTFFKVVSLAIPRTSSDGLM